MISWSPIPPPTILALAVVVVAASLWWSRRALAARLGARRGLIAWLPRAGLGVLLLLGAVVFTIVEYVRYIWMSDAEFDAKVQAYQATQPGPFSFFW